MDMSELELENQERASFLQGGSHAPSDREQEREHERQTSSALNLIADTRPLVDYTQGFQPSKEDDAVRGQQNNGDRVELRVVAEEQPLAQIQKKVGHAYFVALRFLWRPLVAYIVSTIVVMLTSVQTCLLLAVGVCAVRASFLVFRANHYDSEKRLVTLVCVVLFWALSLLIPTGDTPG